MASINETSLVTEQPFSGELIAAQPARQAFIGSAAVRRCGMGITSALLIATSSIALVANAQPDSVAAVSASPGSQMPDSVPVPASATPSTSIEAPKPVERVEIANMVPVLAVFTMKQGVRTVQIAPTTMLTEVDHQEKKVIKTIDPPLIYCPGVNPTKSTVKYTIGKTQTECETMYFYADFGTPSYGVPTQQKLPTVIAAHTSSFNYATAGNFIRGIQPDDTLTLYDDKGDSITYRARDQHLYPVKETNAAGVEISQVPSTSIAIITCEANSEKNNLVILDAVSAHLAVAPQTHNRVAA